MNQKDLKILAYLRQDARMPLTSMSKKTGIPVSTIFDRLRNNENNVIFLNSSSTKRKIKYCIKRGTYKHKQAMC